MSNFAGAPSYQLSAKRNTAVSATDGIRVQIADTFRIQSVKMPDYSRFASNALSLSNDYNFSLEHTVINKYQAEEKAAAASKLPDRPPPPPPTAPDQKKEQTYPGLPMPSGDLLRPSAADVTPRTSGLDSGNAALINSRSNGNEWADFERSRDLFDDLELKSMDDRHELARVLVSNHHSESQPNTPNRNQQQQQSGLPNAPSIVTSLVDEHKKMSYSDNNLSSMASTSGSSAVGGRNSPAPAPPGPFYSSASDLSAKVPSLNSSLRDNGLPRSTPTPSPPPVQLTAAQQTAVAHTTAMGFDRQVCSRLAHNLNTDSEEVLANAVLAYSSLVAGGHNPDNCERALVLVGGDERKARTVLEASSYLEQFGFGRSVIYAAVSRLLDDKKSQASPSAFNSSDELRDKLLDMLTADSS